MITTEELEKILELAGKATPGEWKWEDAYEHHKECVPLGLEAKCTNITDGRIHLVSGEEYIISEWASYADDSGLSISLPNAKYIASVSPDRITEIVKELIEFRKMPRSGLSSGVLIDPAGWPDPCDLYAKTGFPKDEK